jgi:hypothetical protein
MFPFAQHPQTIAAFRLIGCGYALSKSHHSGMIACMSQSALITNVSNAALDTCKACIKAVFDGESVVDFLRDVGMEPQAFYETLKKNPELLDAYADAKRFRAEILANEIVHIADSEDDPQKARNRIQARQWFASKVAPRDWGDRMDINVTQTIDIGSALQDARARALRPVCDQRDEPDSQVVDYKEVIDLGPADEQSTVQLPAPAPSPSSLTARANQAAGAAPAQPKRGRNPKGAP